jgi:hypothetical protein
MTLVIQDIGPKTANIPPPEARYNPVLFFQLSEPRPVSSTLGNKAINRSGNIGKLVNNFFIRCD